MGFRIANYSRADIDPLSYLNLMFHCNINSSKLILSFYLLNQKSNSIKYEQRKKQSQESHNIDIYSGSTLRASIHYQLAY